MAATDWVAVSNDRMAALVDKLKAEGIDATYRPPGEGGSRGSIGIKVGDKTLDVKALDKREGYGSRSTYTFDGFFIRWDWEGRRGMGSIRYPLRKDGSVDIERLKGDIESWSRREASRNDAALARSARQKAMEVPTRVLKEEAAARNGGHVYVEVENDGTVDGEVKFKISGHIPPHRLMALLALLDVRKPPEPREMGPVFLDEEVA